MSVPLYDTDVQKITDRTAKTTLADTDVLVVANASGTLAPITKVNTKETLGINANATAITTLNSDVSTAGSVLKAVKDNAKDATFTPTGGIEATTIKGAIAELDSEKADKDTDAVAGNFAYFDVEGNPVDSGHKDADYEPSDATILKKAQVVDALNSEVVDVPLSANQGMVLDGKVDEVKTSLLATKLAVNELERQAQIGNGATLDFSDIGSVALDARATGRANPTVEGLTATNTIPVITAISVAWDAVNAGVPNVTGGVVSFTATAKSGAVRYTFPNPTDFSGKTCYVAFWVKTDSAGVFLNVYDGNTSSNAYHTGGNNWELLYVKKTHAIGATSITARVRDDRASGWTQVQFKYAINVILDNHGLASYTASDCAKIFSYFDGTKSIQLPARIISKSEDESETSTLYIADNEEVRSIQDVQDLLSMVNGEYIYTKKVSTPASVLSGVAVNVTNYPTAKTGGKFAVELTAGGTQIGVIGTDSTSGAGMLRFELATPVTTNLTTSGTLKAFSNGSVYWEPYYEGSHQTNASSQITLPYEGTIDAVYGYDENLVEYELLSSEYSLVGGVLTITGALENEVWFVRMSRSEPLAPEMSVNVINNAEVAEDSVTGKFYKKTFTVANGVPTFGIEEVV